MGGCQGRKSSRRTGETEDATGEEEDTKANLEKVHGGVGAEEKEKWRKEGAEEEAQKRKQIVAGPM